MNTFEQSILVEESHLDELQHVNNVQYLQWVQDIAGAHWQHLIRDNPTEFGLWVVRSHHIEYKRQAKLGDRLRVITHVELTEGFLSERRVRFFLEDSNTLVAQCSTQWCYLDPTSQKLLRIPEEVHAIFA
ncbi:MAG: thioesterase [Flavobacteriaceae bacterium]|jgi:acyl-CoA thioester hydrolase|nr:thioesterase [Flavobacteriaceae bacterium]